MDAVQRIADFVAQWRERTPDSEAIVSEGRRISYLELEQEVDACARALMAHGIMRGDRVAVLCTARWEAFVVFYALCRVGAVWVGLNPRHLLNEMVYVVEDSRPSAIFAMSGFEKRDYRTIATDLAENTPSIRLRVAIAGQIEGFTPLAAFLNSAERADHAAFSEACRSVCPDDCAAIVYTSGSTGQPKGAMLPQRGLIAAQSGKNLFGLSAYRALNNFPLDHVGGLTDIALYMLMNGGTCFLSQRFRAKTDLDIIESEKITLFFQTVGQCVEYEALPDFADRDLSHVEFFIWAGESVPTDMILRWGKTAKHNRSGWGMTETCGGAVTTWPGTDIRTVASCIGKPAPGVSARIIDDQGEPVGPGTVGELCIRGDLLMLGYLNRPEATADAIDREGWLHSGDLVVEQPDGNLRFVGRKKQMFKSGGFNVYPREIELVLEKQDTIATVVVVDAPHPKYTQVGVAFVVPKHPDSLHEDALKDLCRDELANYKIPKRFFIRDSLPMLGSGKIDRKALSREVQTLF